MEKRGQFCEWERRGRESKRDIVIKSKCKGSPQSYLYTEGARFLALSSLSLANCLVVTMPMGERVWELQNYQALISKGTGELIYATHLLCCLLKPEWQCAPGLYPRPFHLSHICFLPLKQGNTCDWVYLDGKMGKFTLGMQNTLSKLA